MNGFLFLFRFLSTQANWVGPEKDGGLLTFVKKEANSEIISRVVMSKKKKRKVERQKVARIQH